MADSNDSDKHHRSLDRPLIYILDDDQSIVDLLATTLSRSMTCDARPYTELEALLKDEHLEYADLLVVDINLGDGASGFDIPARLPIQCRFAAILFVSGYPVDNGEFKQVADLPFFDFIQKPFSTEVFVNRVNRLLAARLAVPPEVDDSLVGHWSLPPFVAVVLDEAYEVAFVNNELAKLLGLRHPGELVGRSWSDFIPREFHHTLEKVHGAVLEGDTQNYGEYTSLVRSVDGQIKSVRWYNSPFEGADGALYTLSVGVPSGFKDSVHRQFRTQFRDMLKKHRAAIRAYRRVKSTKGQPDPACIIEEEV